MSSHRFSGRLGVVAVLILNFAALCAAQDANQANQAKPLPTDWTYRHIIFSHAENGKIAQLVAHDPRFVQQNLRQGELLRVEPGSQSHAATRPKLPPKPLKRDWAEDMGAGASVGAGIFPAKYSFNINTANCGTATQPDFVVYGTGLQSSSTQASIVAYDNLYAGCGGTVPSPYWAYDTGGQIETSPVLSLDGTQVAFVQTNAAHEGTLVLLKWAASTIETAGAPMTLTAVSNAAYPTCIAPCMTTIILRDGPGVATDDTTSSVFYDYTNDVVWVGGAFGWLHKVANVFNGTATTPPAEVRTGGFPVQLQPANPTSTSSPVYDRITNNVYLGDYGGYFYRVDASNGTVVQLAQVDFGAGVVAPPIVDVAAGLVYVFASSDGSGSCTAGADCTAVLQLSATFLSTDTPAEAIVGTSTVSGVSTPEPLYDGFFDSAYLSSTTRSGSLYVCGNTGGPPIIYQVSITAGVMTHVTSGPVISNALGATPCSPVTDIRNPNASGGSTEWIFASTGAQGVATACASAGCMLSFVDTPWSASTAYSVGQQVLDSNLNIQTVTTAGTSGATVPVWSLTKGNTTTDGSVVWTTQDALSGFTDQAWASKKSYSKGNEILDGNGNIQLVTKGGLSGNTTPNWSTTPGASTTDNLVTWKNVGATPTAALQAAGGTSGFVIDNFVPSGTLTGASQLYFSTLSDQTCSTSGGTGGCAVQASQQGLN